jgi:uncharacterized membrane protein
LREHDVIRLIDLLLVNKDDDGNVTAIEASDLTQEEAMEFGATVGALIGLGEGGEAGAAAGAAAGAEALVDGHVFGEHEVWFVTDSIPNGHSAAIALLEHRWAIPLRDAMLRAGGTMLDESWVHPLDLVAVGLARAEEAESL